MTSPIDDLRDREDELEEIAESGAPDAPVADVMLSLLREGEHLEPAQVEAINPEATDDA